MTTEEKYRFLFILPFHLPPTARYRMRPMSGPKEGLLMNYDELESSLDGVEWDIHRGPLAPHGDWPVESREEFTLVGAARLPIVREACASKKYNGIVLLGGGDPCFIEAREIGRRFNIPVTSCAHSQMHIASMLGNKFSIIDLSEVHNMRMQDLVVQYRFTDRCGSIHNINYPLPRPPYDDEYLLEQEKEKAQRGETSDIIEAGLRACVEAIEENGAETLILGCSASYWMRPLLENGLRKMGWSVPVLDGYRSAILHLKFLVDLGVNASGLAFPLDHPKKWRSKKVI